MGERWFKPISVPTEGGRRNVSRIFCSKEGCANFNDIAPSAGGGALPIEPLTKLWHKRGWVVGRTPSGDLCPDCARKAKTPLNGQVLVFHSRDPAPAVAAPVPAVVEAMDMPVLTRELRRKIIASIEDHWNSRDGGWLEDMTDALMARQLKVPRVFVEEVREDVFGPVADNEEIRGLKVKIEESGQRLTMLEKGLDRMIDEVSLARRVYSELVDEAKLIYAKVT